jgi:hypothetical protein
MLNITNLIGFGAGGEDKSLFTLLKTAGLDSNLLVCLDAGDPKSYSGSGQTWFNTVPSPLTDFYLGSTSGSDAYDPSFVGSVGSPDAYFNMPSAGVFVETTAGWGDDEFVKNAFAYTVAFIVSIPSTPSTTQNFYAIGNTTPPYGRLGVNSGPNLTYFLDPTSGGSSRTTAGTTSVPINQQVFLAGSISSVASSTIFQVNGTQQTVSTTISDSNTSGASGPSAIGRWANDAAFQPILANTKIFGFLVWSTNLSASQLTSLRSALLTRWSEI